MDKKYLGRVVNLPKAALENLVAVQGHLTSQFGFTPSLSETMTYLCKFWTDHNVKKPAQTEETCD